MINAADPANGGVFHEGLSLAQRKVRNPSVVRRMDGRYDVILFGAKGMERIAERVSYDKACEVRDSNEQEKEA